jgi:CBS-domain-containing membrane protein
LIEPTVKTLTGATLGRVSRIIFKGVLINCDQSSLSPPTSGLQRDFRDMDVRKILDMKGDMALTTVSNATIDEASEMLRENYFGAIGVADQSDAVGGILSERDIAGTLTQSGGTLREKPMRST